MVLLSATLYNEGSKWTVCGVTLHRSRGSLCELDMALCDVVGRLVLDDLNARADVTFTMEEEGETAGQVFAAGRR